MAAQEEHVQALSTEALQQQLQLVKQLRGRLDISEPMAAANGHTADPLAVATYVDAARNLLVAQLRLQREVSLPLDGLTAYGVALRLPCFPGDCSHAAA